VDAKRAIETVPLRGYCFVLPVQHDPSRAEGSTWGHLPPLLSRPVGREGAIATVVQALDRQRLVTITGPGGIGKTTVAVATVSQIGPAALRFVDLSHVATGDEAAMQIARSLGVETTDGGFERLCRALGDRDLLLILDTCEHIVAEIAMLVESLLAHCPKLRLLVTSREALRATGEWTHRLPSLHFPPTGAAIDEANAREFSAVALFLERAQSSTGLDLEDRHVPLVAEICRRLDGIPLALELAAARVADLGVHEIAANLDDCFSILTRGRRTALPRHRTLSATLDWSYNLLSGDERALLHHLSSMTGPFLADEAVSSAAAAGFEHCAERLLTLYEKSLLSVELREDAPSYRLLATTKSYLDARQLAPA